MLPAAVTVQPTFSLPPPSLRPLPIATVSPERRHFSRRSPRINDSNNHFESTTASWTSSMAHHCKNGQLCEAMSQFTRMRTSGIQANHVTFVTLLSGCARFPSEGKLFGPIIHGHAIKLGLYTHDVMVGTATIDMYSKIGQIGLARLCFDHMDIKNKVSWNSIINGYMRNRYFQDAINLFDEMPDRDAVSFTVLIDGFVKSGMFDEALNWFKEMQLFGVAPDFVTIVSVLSAVANIGTLGLGLWLHRFVQMQDLRDNTRVNNSLIDMYCRCGCVKLACQVFDKMSDRSLVSWNSIIVGLACNARAEEALAYFHSMKIDGFKPDSVSFTGALTACSHAGLVDEALELFKTMTEVYKISATIEHYGCLVDLYSRAGRLEESLKVVDSMPMKPNEVVVGSLFAACRACGDIDLAERLMTYIYDLDPSGDFNYVLLSNMYAAKGRWRGASNVRKKMKALGVEKRPGISSIEVNGSVHDFVASDKSHDDADSIFTMLKLLSNELRTYGHLSEDLYESEGG